MIRRAPTSIQLKLDDICEYEEKQQELAKSKSQPNRDDIPMWQPKTRQEVYTRIGFNPDRNQVPRTLPAN